MENWYDRMYGDLFINWHNFKISTKWTRYVVYVVNCIRSGWHYGREYCKLFGGGVHNGISCAKQMISAKKIIEGLY